MVCTGAQHSGEQPAASLKTEGLTRKPSNVSVLLSLTLMPPTPPRAHVFTSKNQIVLLSVMGTTRFVIAVPFTVSRKPGSKPLIVIFVSCAGMHGDANVLCVTVWFPRVTGAGSGR